MEKSRSIESKEYHEAVMARRIINGMVYNLELEGGTMKSLIC